MEKLNEKLFKINTLTTKLVIQLTRAYKEKEKIEFLIKQRQRSLKKVSKVIIYKNRKVKQKNSSKKCSNEQNMKSYY